MDPNVVEPLNNAQTMNTASATTARTIAANATRYTRWLTPKIVPGSSVDTRGCLPL